ncbi:hypothetical protein DORI_73 [Mycobacterium phage Dori]|nr:hypothetical protein DORI_73 [Mycobacterium phage Dori]AER47722.1 hypothetical protein DORI_73 [Mycobacterium phage Dori]
MTVEQLAFDLTLPSQPAVIERDARRGRRGRLVITYVGRWQG